MVPDELWRPWFQCVICLLVGKGSATHLVNDKNLVVYIH